MLYQRWQVIKASLRQQPSRRSYPILSSQHTHTFILRSNINRNHMILVVSWHRLDISIQVTFHSGDTFRLEVSIRRVYLEESWVAPGPEDGTRTVMLSSASESIEVVVCDSRISLYIKVSRTVLCSFVHALQKSVEVVVCMRCTSGGWRFTCCSWTLPCTRYVGRCYHGDWQHWSRQGSDAVISVSLIVCVNGYEGKGFHNNKVDKINYE